MARSRWIAPLCGAAAVIGGLLTVSLFVGRAGNVPQAASRNPQSLFFKEEPRLSQAPIDAFTVTLELTDDQRSRIQTILQAVRTHDQRYQQKRMATVMALYRAPLSAAPPPAQANPAVRAVTSGVERLKSEWRRRQIKAAFDGLDTMEREHSRTLQELESRAAQDVQGVLTERQRQKVPKIQKAMHDLRSVGLPISFCTEMLQDPPQSAAIAAIATEADRQRKRNAENYRTAVRAARAARKEAIGEREWKQERQQILMTTYETIAKADRKAYIRALLTLTPRQRRSIRRSQAFFTP